MGAFLKGAFSKGANLKGAFLKGANLKGAFLQHNPIMVNQYIEAGMLTELLGIQLDVTLLGQSRKLNYKDVC